MKAGRSVLPKDTGMRTGGPGDRTIGPLAIMDSCPICHCYFSTLHKHLKNTHCVSNVQERQILLNLAAGRVNICAAPCPVLGWNYMLTRLDRHVKQSHAELTNPERTAMLFEVKRRLTLRLMGDTRTADQFYMANPDHSEAAEVRVWVKIDGGELYQTRLKREYKRTVNCCDITAAVRSD
ncbi:Hypothetical protein SMAX5B_015359 [Scophthalmus maximus]|uniref:Uncharacterized protein n=1 Tax=Scophthalmus maximus TaxID=52904 RepID=A0A2U9C9X5_SCOMX|nr:Hypothetical protein SMAX5B_015359 [Scophthalmus maximus]